jgi:ATP-dependent Clp protease ATP-binding subunit ClpB
MRCTLVGARTSEGSAETRRTCSSRRWRAANCTIGATTLNEYRKYVRRGAGTALPAGDVGEPSVRTVWNNCGLGNLNSHHGIRVTIGAIVAAAATNQTVTFPTASCPTRRWYGGRASSRLRMEVESKRGDQGTVDHRIVQLKIEAERWLLKPTQHRRGSARASAN